MVANQKKRLIITSFILVLIFVFLGLGEKTEASRVEELRKEIASHNSEISNLEREIAAYQTQLGGIRQEATTLENEVRQIDTTRQKLATDITLTERRINTANLNLERIALEMQENEDQIETGRETIKESIRRINFAESASLIEIFLTHNSLSDFLAETSTLEQLQFQIQGDLSVLKAIQAELMAQEKEIEATKSELSALIIRLANQRQIADEQRREQNILLASTREEESAYQALLSERLARKRQIEEEIRNIESQIKFQLDPGSIPDPGGVLRWPLNNIRITQYFGNTPFATQNPQIYSGSGHGGIDLAASVGTPVFAAEAGRVIAIDNTDRVCPRASYGMYLLIEHDNGLSTLYAHLSRVAVREGERVTRGQEVAYTGNTGYSTGPHLHFEVLVSDAVRVTDGITELRSASCAGAVYRIPLSGYNGKLNPLSFLPPAS